MLYEILCLVISALGVYGLYALLRRFLPPVDGTGLSFSDGVHVRLGFSELEIEAVLARPAS